MNAPMAPLGCDIGHWNDRHQRTCPSYRRPTSQMNSAEDMQAVADTVAAALSQQVERPLDVALLAKAIDLFITDQTGFDVDDAQAIADIYARLASPSTDTEPLPARGS